MTDRPILYGKPAPGEAAESADGRKWLLEDDVRKLVEDVTRLGGLVETMSDGGLRIVTPRLADVLVVDRSDRSETDLAVELFSHRSAPFEPFLFIETNPPRPMPPREPTDEAYLATKVATMLVRDHRPRKFRIECEAYEWTFNRLKGGSMVSTISSLIFDHVHGRRDVFADLEAMRARANR